MNIDDREITYKRIMSLGTNDKYYFSDLCTFTKMLLNDADQKELKQMERYVCELFNDGSGNPIPPLFYVEYTLNAMEEKGTRWIRTGNIRKLHKEHIIFRLNELKSFCWDKMEEVKKQIRFSGSNVTPIQ